MILELPTERHFLSRQRLHILRLLLLLNFILQ